MNVFGYARVSGKSQIEGDGFPRQESAIASFCAAYSLTSRRVFREEGVSGTVEGLDRPAFADLLADVDNFKTSSDGPIEAIVVERLDRLARDLMVSEVLLMELRKRGIKVFSADQGATLDMASDGGDPTRVLMRQIMGALAQWEKTMLVKKLRAAKDRLKAQGKMGLEGTLPLGSKPGERDVLNFMLSHHPAMNYKQLAVLLNSGDYKTRSGAIWTPQNVRSAIINARKKERTTNGPNV